MQQEAPACGKSGDPLAPGFELGGIIVKEGEVVDVPQVPLGAEDFLAEVIQAIQVDVGEQVTGQVADWLSPPSCEWREQVVAGKAPAHGLLRVGRVADDVGRRLDAGTPDAAAPVAREDRMVDGRGAPVDIGAEHVPALLPKVSSRWIARWVPLPLRMA